MDAKKRTLRVAVVQAAPVIMDRDETIKKAIALIKFVNPFGQYVAGPVFDREEIFYADLDLDQVVQSRLDFDPTGHYARPDVFKLTVEE